MMKKKKEVNRWQHMVLLRIKEMQETMQKKCVIRDLMQVFTKRNLVGASASPKNNREDYSSHYIKNNKTFKYKKIAYQ